MLNKCHIASVFSSSVCVGSYSAKIKHVILFSDRFRLLFFHFSIVMCFFMTKSVMLTCCAPLILMGARYYYSRKVILNYLDCALHTDMADIEAYYMKPTGKTHKEPHQYDFSVTCEINAHYLLTFDNAPPPVLTLKSRNYSKDRVWNHSIHTLKSQGP